MLNPDKFCVKRDSSVYEESNDGSVSEVRLLSTPPILLPLAAVMDVYLLSWNICKSVLLETKNLFLFRRFEP